MLVDTLSSPGEADEMLAEVAERFERPIRWVVNTHAHYTTPSAISSWGRGRR